MTKGHSGRRCCPTLNQRVKHKKPLTVPDHRTLKSGLLRHLMHDTQVDPEELRRLLNQ
jgi:hypothetical protein